MNMERPGSPSAKTVAPASRRRSTSMETSRSRLASERPPKKGVASKNAFRSGELATIHLIYSRSRQRQAGQAVEGVARANFGPTSYGAGIRRRRSLYLSVPSIEEPSHEGHETYDRTELGVGAVRYVRACKTGSSSSARQDL